MDNPVEIHTPKKKGKIREYFEALATALLAAFLIRSFIIEPFKIPSGSMIPTLVVGDHIFVNKFIYGLRIPFTKKKVVEFKTPERGDAVVFIYPVDESKDFIKRVVGLPGDHLLLHDDDVIVNGERLPHRLITIDATAETKTKTGGLLQVVRDATATESHVESIPSFRGWEDFQYYVEVIEGKPHLVQYDLYPSLDEREIIVPADHLFVMGDNRDNSADSREWGFVPMENVKGKAMFVWLSLDLEGKTLRWNRFGKWIR